jgi:murein DD-endopeptidase MepM/ murein hydrolase activator NlpD
MSGSDPMSAANGLMGLASLARDQGVAIDTSKDVGKQAEILFAKLLLSEVRKAAPKEGLMGGQAASMWQGLFDETVAERIAETGGLGLADQVNRWITEAGGTADTLALRPLRAGGAQGTSEPHVTSRFGARRDPISGRHRAHHGLDIGAATGTPIKALRPGRVTFAGDAGTYGNLVVVDHGDGLETRYAHASELDVGVGDEVMAGQTVARVGSTGRSTGPHLHLEVRRHGHAVDPEAFVGDPARVVGEKVPQLTPEPER